LRDALQAQSARSLQGVSALFCQNADCGVEIPAARRAALPGVRLCIDCQEIKERTRT
jgi:phage/conjugal plasmid C-4 type zinc finger TraR family protein